MYVHVLLLCCKQLYDCSEFCIADFRANPHLIIHYLPPLGGDAVFLPAIDDIVSEAISPPDGFPVFGRHYSNLYVCVLVVRTYTYVCMYMFVCIRSVVEFSVGITCTCISPTYISNVQCLFMRKNFREHSYVSGMVSCQNRSCPCNIIIQPYSVITLSLPGA